MKKDVLKIKKRWGLYYGEPYKLDLYDRKILLELQDNARQTLQELHKKIGLSRDAIRNRIDKLIKADVILGFTLTLNHPKVGFPIISYVLLALENVARGGRAIHKIPAKSPENNLRRKFDRKVGLCPLCRSEESRRLQLYSERAANKFPGLNQRLRNLHSAGRIQVRRSEYCDLSAHK